MTENNGQGSVATHPIAPIVFQVFDDVPNEDEQVEIKCMIENKALKVFKIKGNGKKRKNDQSGSNGIADPKQPFEAAALEPNGKDKKPKKQKGHPRNPSGNQQGGNIEQYVQPSLGA